MKCALCKKDYPREIFPFICDDCAGKGTYEI